MANVRNLSTGYVSPPYNIVFDDLFKTVVSSGKSDLVVDAICNQLFEAIRTLC